MSKYCLFGYRNVLITIFVLMFICIYIFYECQTTEFTEFQPIFHVYRTLPYNLHYTNCVVIKMRHQNNLHPFNQRHKKTLIHSVLQSFTVAKTQVLYRYFVEW